MRVTLRVVGLAFLLGGCGPQESVGTTAAALRGDPGIVVQWANAFVASIKASGTNPADTARLGAILHAAIFDAVNGIEHRYAPLHEDEDAPGGARSDAAAAQAGHDVMVKLFPSSAATFDGMLASMIAAIPGSEGNSVSISDGQAWGAHVAADILAWRSTDGRGCNPTAPGTLCPNHVGQTGLGQWRPVPPTPAGAPAVLPQWVVVAPFTMTSRTEFSVLAGGPPALDSAEYADNVNEVKSYGRKTGSLRSQYQTNTALFYYDNSPSHWERVAVAAAVAKPSSLVETARIFALLNAAMSDAVVTVWNAKFTWNAWRPFTAIHEPTTYNAGVTSDSTFVTLLPNPNHQEYPSAHSIVAGAAEVVLNSYYGDDLAVTHYTETVNPLLTETTRTTTFSQMAEETANSRVWVGIHFRFSVETGRSIGQAVGQHAVDTALGSANGNAGKISHDHPNVDFVSGGLGEGFTETDVSL